MCFAGQGDVDAFDGAALPRVGRVSQGGREEGRRELVGGGARRLGAGEGANKKEKEYWYIVKVSKTFSFFGLRGVTLDATPYETTILCDPHRLVQKDDEGNTFHGLSWIVYVANKRRNVVRAFRL